ncbi:DUF4362 domain-containing protein [Cytobacillus dafuensis]|uniref:DUF4362 domain-containing protein n=1 Tax=Cytobacillus dafuensis TaxID=1742359 RepID=A0A5B8Z1G5_CYTDA|nr:DUF4362 domain-containing protein [Cytobacillus dafuensis]QED46805.1 DUF4362 domain-containing protein [Cytobacillus dafuensis]
MKKFQFILFVLLFLSGCSNLNPVPSSTTYEPQQKDVINNHGGIENIEQIDQFVNNINNGENDEVRIIHYTIEGDPIIWDLTYDGTSIQSRYDTTYDKFGSGKVEKHSCERITKSEMDTEIAYKLECNGQQEDVLTVQYDTEKQDKFEFHFKYGVDKKNEVDTANQRLVKDLQNGEVSTVSDFQFNRKELNQIYKAMVLTNYLDQKDLSNSCNKKPYESYELTIWINGGERHFEWTECDISKHGLQMNKMKNNILHVIRDNETYKSLPPTKGVYQ